MRVEDGGFGVADEGELASLHLEAFFLRRSLGEADTSNLRVGIGAARDARFVDRLGELSGEPRGDDQAGHAANVRQLRHAADDVADGVNAGFGRLHPLVGHDEGAVGLDVGRVQADVGSARRAADGNQDLFRLLLLRLAVLVGPGDQRAVLVLLDFGVLDAEVHVDAALLVEAQEFLRDVFIFHRHDARQHFEDSDFGAEALEDGGELDAYRA